MKLPINDTFTRSILVQANIELEEARQRGLASRFPLLVPQEPVTLCAADVDAVLTALYVFGYFTPPLWREIDHASTQNT